MKKVLFFEGKEKRDFLKSIQTQLEIKNRLLGLIIANPDKKTSSLESSQKAFKLEQQIILLQLMLRNSEAIHSQNDIRKLNSIIEQYRLLDK